MNKNALEWSVFGISLVLVLTFVGALVYEAAQPVGRPPVIEVRLGQPEPAPGGWAVPVTAHNRSDRTAQLASVEVELQISGKAPETATLEFDWIPKRSSRSGQVTFSSDPSQGQLSGRAVAYRTP